MPTPSANKWEALIAVAIAVFMSTIDSSIVNISLPTISRTLDASMSEVSWVILAYILILTSLLLIFGRMADRVGQKRFFSWGFTIFAIGSALCGASPSVGFLIAFRAYQAVGAAILIAIGQAIVSRAFPEEERGKALGLLSVPLSLGLICGPAIGGFITATIGWRWIFYVNVPIGLIGLYLGRRGIPDYRPARARDGAPGIDTRGAVLLFLSIAALTVTMSFGNDMGWTSPPTLIIVTVFFLAAFAFAAIEAGSAHPLLEVGLFRSRGFSLAVASASMSFVAAAGLMFLFPFFLELVKGLTPKETGALMILVAAAMLVAGPAAGALSDRLGARLLTSSGMAVCALTFFCISRFTEETPIYVIALALIAAGLGTGLFSSPNTSAMLGAVSPDQQTVGSSIGMTSKNLGLLLGVALMESIFSGTLHLGSVGLGESLAPLALSRPALCEAFSKVYEVAALFALAAMAASIVRGGGRRRGKD